MYFKVINKELKTYCVIVIMLVHGFSFAQEKNEKGRTIVKLAGNERYFSDSFEEWPLSTVWKFDVVDKRISISPDSTVANDGKYSISAILRPGDLANGGERSEVKIFPNHQAGSVAFYSFDFFLPSDFDTLGNSISGSIHMICQFHEQPTSGLTWEEFKKDSTRNFRPSVAVNYFSENGFEYLCLTYGNHRFYPVPIEQSDISKIKISRGEWISLKFLIKWSLENDGFIELLVNDQHLINKNGEEVKRYFGANMTNTSPVSVKMGLYRPKGLYVTTNKVYFDSFKMGVVEN